MSEPKNQHIIPQCYLKQFVDPNTPKGYEPYVWIFERGTKKGKKKAPKNILTETDFYTIEVEGGEKDYTIEKTLAQIEGEYTLVFEKKIKNRIPLSSYEHVILCAFVAAMLQRTSRQRENLEGFIDQIVERIEEMEKEHNAPPKASLEWRREKENAHRISLIQSIPHVTKILVKMNLAFLCASKDSFITSDAPCFMFNSQLQGTFYGPGLAQEYVEVRMPLSPEISASFTWANNVRGYLGIDKDWVHECNRMVFGYSDKYFIANSPNLRRGWFRRFPLDPIFLWRILKQRAKAKLMHLRYKYHV